MSETSETNKGFAVHIICPLPNFDDNGELTVLCGLAPKTDSRPQITVPPETAGFTSAALAVVESASYVPKFTHIKDKSIQNLARKLTNYVIPLLNQTLHLRIPIADQTKESKSPVASTYIKLPCEEYSRLVDYYDDRTTRFMQMPSFGETDAIQSESTIVTAEPNTDDAAIINAKISKHQCAVCGHTSGKCILIKLVEAICKDLRRNNVKITNDLLLGIVKPQAVLYIN